MNDCELYRQILGIEKPWKVIDVVIDREEGEVVVLVDRASNRALRCPTCNSVCPRHDIRQRRWRHLDTCQFRTILLAGVPRVKCKTHGVLQIPLPWAEPGSRFTALFESLVISWLREATISAVARELGLGWSEVDGIMTRAVRRGQARQQVEAPKKIAVDETSYQKRHEYVTVVSSGGVVQYVADDRKASSLDGFYESIGEKACAAIEEVTMDMCEAYISSTRSHVPDADERIVFDRFHVAKALGDAVDRTRRKENKELLAVGDESLKGSRYLWLENPLTMRRKRWLSFADLRASSLRTAEAWAMKEAAMNLWGYQVRGWAERAWKNWVEWVLDSGVEAMKNVANTILRHWHGVMNAALSASSNAGAESINAKIQRVKKMACGFRNRDRFRTAIYFHLGGLDLYPTTVDSSHPIP